MKRRSLSRCLLGRVPGRQDAPKGIGSTEDTPELRHEAKNAIIAKCFRKSRWKFYEMPHLFDSGCLEALAKPQCCSACGPPEAR